MSVVVGLSDDQIWSLGFEFLRSCNDSGADRNDWLTTFREDFRALGDFMVPGDTPSLVVPSRLDIDASQSMVAAGERGRVGGQLAIGVVVCLSDRAVFTGTVGVVRAKRHSLVIPYDTIRDVYLIEYLEHGRNVPALEVLADRRWGLLSLPKFDQTRDLGLLLNTLNGVTVPHWGNFNCDGELLDARGPSRCPECGNVHKGVIAWTEADREPSGAPGGSPEQEHPSHTTRSTATRCESCNAEIDSGDRFCHSCGTGLAEPEETAVVSAAADPLRLDRDSERAAGIVEQVKDLDAERLKRIVGRHRELAPRSDSLDAANEIATREEAVACEYCSRRIRDILTENRLPGRRLEGTSVSDGMVVAEAGRNAALAYLLGDRLDEADRRSLLELWLGAVGEPPATGDLVELALQDKNSQRADSSDPATTGGDSAVTVAPFGGVPTSTVVTPLGDPRPDRPPVPQTAHRPKQDRRTRLTATVAALAVGVVLALGIGRWLSGSDPAAPAIAAGPEFPLGVIDRISVGAEPRHVAVSGDMAWVTNADDDTASVIDIDSRSVIETVAVGDQPEEIAVSEDVVWVTNAIDDTVSVIDIESRVVIETVPVGDYPYGIALADEAAWVVNFGDGTVSVIDRDSFEVTDTVRVTDAADPITASGPMDVVVAGDAAWVSVELGDQADEGVTVIDVGTHDIQDTIDVEDPNLLALVGDDVWVSHRDGTVSLISTDTRSVVDTVAVPGGTTGPFGGGITGMALGADAMWLSIVDEGSRDEGAPTGGSIATVDLETLDLIERLRLDGFPAAISVVRDSVWVPNLADADVVVVGSSGNDRQGLELRDDGLGLVSFGDPEDEVITAVEAALGPADGDELRREMSECTEHTVWWGLLSLDFDSDEGEREFVGWALSDRGDRTAASGPDLQTEHGLGIGSSGAEVVAVPGVETYSDGSSFEVGTLQIYLDGPAPDSQVEYMEAGFSGCFE